MHKHVYTAISIALLSIGMTASAGNGDRRLEIQGTSNFMLSLFNETEYDYSGGGKDEIEETGYDLELTMNIYLADTFSIGFDVGESYWHYEDKSADYEEDELTYSLSVRGDHYFVTEGKVIPYVGIHVGYLFGTSEGEYDWGGEEERDITGPMYGVQTGLKFFIADNVALDLRLRYSKMDIEYSVDRSWTSDYEYDEETETVDLTIAISVFF